MNDDDLSELSMLELFRMEAESQGQVLTTGLLALEREPTAAGQLEACMRAAHSLKGAARIVGLNEGVGIAHAMEDCFVAAQRGEVTLRQRQIDLLLAGVDLLTRIAKAPEKSADGQSVNELHEVSTYPARLKSLLENSVEEASLPESQEARPAAGEPVDVADLRDISQRGLRVTADNLNRLLGLAGESLVESHRVKPFADSLLRLKRLHSDAGKLLCSLQEELFSQTINDGVKSALTGVQQRFADCNRLLSESLIVIEAFNTRSTDLAKRLYDEALSCRMRPFSDGARPFPRLVRDLSQELGKQIRLELIGDDTQVDRDILERLDAPLNHLLRNAIDHGIDSPEERRAAGKPIEGVIRLEARHHAGVLQILVSDDGRGVDLDRLRRTVVERRLTNWEIVEKLTEAELLEFLFLPGFSMKDTVSEISGRGVGLDVVQNMLKQVHGTIRVSSVPGSGVGFLLQLPLTLSVVHTLLVDIGGEPYAFPLAEIARALRVPRKDIELLEGRPYLYFDGNPLGLVSANQVLGGPQLAPTGDQVSVIVLGASSNAYGLLVDRFLGERELVVQPLDARLGKVKDMAAGALMEDGSPVLIVDVKDIIRSIEKLVSTGTLSKVSRTVGTITTKIRKRVLVVDDSLTVRELERKLLDEKGYEVESAVDGVDGLNAARTGHFDLIVTDVDMPRMDGIEMVTFLKRDANLKSVPVMIVSYKDREEDRLRGLEAGADYYLTKGSFHDETLIQAVIDLIGEAQA